MRLSAATAASLPPDVRRPSYDRTAIRTGVVHLGVGAFHRAHQAIVFEDALEQGDDRWGILGASLRSSDVRDRLAPQDGLYTVNESDGRETRTRLIGALREVLVAPDDPARLVAAMADRDVHLVTLTITEKGYARDTVPDGAWTAPALIAAALAERRRAGLAPFTAISCDNLPGNGARLRDAVIEIAEARDPRLKDWIEREGAFPETMVDRIVPATEPADIAALASRLGIEDRAMVKTEPFLQWIIEDRFAGERPQFATNGVRIVRSVAPWEEAKLRLLNGAHSAIAYLGGLAGVTFVDDFVARAEGRNFVEMLWDEAAETLSPSAGLDIPAYRAALMTRFANPALQHRTRQIAIDGSQKLPQRLIAPLIARRAAGADAPAITLAVAAWMRWVGGRDEAGAAHIVDDPLAGVIAARLTGQEGHGERVAALLPLLSERLAADAVLHRQLTKACRDLAERGAMATLRAMRQGSG